MNEKRGSKKGQVTIFIIIAVLVVAGIVSFFIFSGDSEDTQSQSQDLVQSPSEFLQSCMEGKVFGTIREISRKGGSIEPEPSIEFDFEEDSYGAYNITYLCYSQFPGNACVPQEASLIKNMENEIRDEISESTESCFNDLISTYENQGYSVSGGNYDSSNDLGVDLVEDRIEITQNASELTLERTNETRNIKEFKYGYPTKLYNLGEIANYIVKQENDHGSIDTGQFVLDYPQYELTIDTTNDQSKIYTLNHRETNTKLIFAVRGYTLPDSL